MNAGKPSNDLRYGAAMMLCGAVLATASQLRLEAIPLGPGEALILLGVLVLLPLSARSQSVGTGAIDYEFLEFWSMSAILLSVGALVGTVVGSDPGRSAIYDTFAYLFAAAFCVALETVASRHPGYCARVLILSAAAFLVSTLIIGLFARSVAGHQLWYMTIRFQGFSENPNQLALLALATPFFLWQLLRDGLLTGVPTVICLSVACLAAGLLTLSDALVISWTAGLMVPLTIYGARWLRRLVSPVAALGVVVACAFAFLGSLASGVLGATVASAVTFARDAYELGGQGSTRIALWSSAVQALWDSWMLGLGPGAHSGTDGPYGQVEAHNLYLDWAAASGIGGLALLCALLAIAMLRCVRARQWFLLGAVVSLAVFGLFHHSLRQPVFWAVLISASYYARAGQALARPDGATVELGIQAAAGVTIDAGKRT